MDKYISLKICGNPQANSGFGTLLNLNNAYFEVIDKFDVGMNANSFYFSVVVDERQTIYKLIKNNVRSANAARMGSLVFAIGVPRGYVLEDGNSPFAVLVRIKDEFMLRNMVCRDQQTEVYEFTDAPIDNNVFDTIIRENPIMPFLGPWFPMNAQMPQACVELSPEMIGTYLSDVQYPENTRVSEIFVASSIAQSAPLQRLNPVIPQQHLYTVTMNGQPFRQLKNIDEPVSVELKETNNFHAASVAFTFRELKQGKTIAGVVYDPQQELAAITLSQAPKTDKYTIEVDSARLFANPAGLHVMVGNRAEQVRPDMTLVVPKSDAASIQFVYDGPDYDIADWVVSGNKIMLAVRPKRVEPVAPVIQPPVQPVQPLSVQQPVDHDKKKPGLMLVLGLVIGLLIGLLIGFLLMPKGGSENAPVEETEVETKEEFLPEQDSKDPKDLNMDAWMDELSKDDIKLDRIQQIYNACSNDEDYYRNNRNEDYNIVVAYNSFVGKVRSGEYNAVVSCVNSDGCQVMTDNQSDIVSGYFIETGQHEDHYKLNYLDFEKLTDLNTEFGKQPTVETPSERRNGNNNRSNNGNTSGSDSNTNGGGDTSSQAGGAPEDY